MIPSALEATVQGAYKLVMNPGASEAWMFSFWGTRKPLQSQEIIVRCFFFSDHYSLVVGT